MEYVEALSNNNEDGFSSCFYMAAGFHHLHECGMFTPSVSR